MRKILLLLLLILPVLSKAADKAIGHKLTFQVKGVKGDTCYIGHYFGKNQYIKQDTAVADDKGVMIFKGKDTLPRGVYLLVMPHRYLEFMMGNEYQFNMETDTTDMVMHMKIKGSPENDIFYDYQKFTYTRGKTVDSIRKALKAMKNKDEEKKLRSRLEDIDKEVSAYRKKMMAEHPTSLAVKLLKGAAEPEVPPAPKLPNGQVDSSFEYYYYKNHYWDNIDLKDEAIVRTPFFHSKLDKYFTNLVLSVSDSVDKETDVLVEKAKGNKEAFKYIVWYVFNMAENSKVMGMEGTIVHMADKYYTSGKAYWVDTATQRKIKERADILRGVLLGKQAPPLYLTDSNTRRIDLYNVKAKYTVLVFWDSECWHCQQEIPKIHEWYVKNKGKGFEVYAATIERKTDKWKKYIREHKIGDWINVWDGLTVTDFKKVYDVFSTPVIYILDKDKKIIAKRIGAEQLDEFFGKYEKSLEMEKKRDMGKGGK